jgi:tetratricopeptide (TPR) repeat protein
MAADIHALEIAFAKDASLDACLPLCEAYLAAKRFMEAMVVCKKGIKGALPSDPRGRIMLARIYLEQGKLPKAEQELLGILVQHPGEPQASGLLGRTYIEQGRKADATPHLQLALRQDPNNAELRGLVGQLGPIGGAALAPAYAPPPAPALAPLPAAPAGAVNLSAPPAFAPPPAAGASASVAKAFPAGAASPDHAGFPGAAASPDAEQAAALAQAALAGGDLTAVPPVPAGSPLTQPPAGKKGVDDFFAPDSLGFSPEMPTDIETAGTGRLTILGFVPKTGGSWKTTLLGMVFIIASASAYLVWLNHNAHSRAQTIDLFKKIRLSLDADLYASYRDVLALGDKILHIDGKHALTLSAMAYAEAVLAVDHHEPGALQKAQAYLADAQKNSPEENEFRVAARALIAYANKDLLAGVKEVRAVVDRGGMNPLVGLEALRLLDATTPDDPATKKQLRMLVGEVSSQVRVHNYLGFYYARQQDIAHAAKYFDSALQNAKEHPVALLGRDLIVLEQGLGVQQKQADIEKDIQTILALPADHLSPPVAALALFVRAQLLTWARQPEQAAAAYSKAAALDPDNWLFNYLHGMAQLKQGSPRAAMEELKKTVAQFPANLAFTKKYLAACMAAGAVAEAKQGLETAHRLAPKDVDLTLLQAEMASLQHDALDAEKIYRSIGQQDGNDAFTTAQLRLSALLRQRHHAEEAVALMEGFLGKMPESTPQQKSRSWCELGEAYAAAKNPHKAMESLRQGIEAYRYNAGCHEALCRVAGDSEEGQEACKTYATLEPHGHRDTAAVGGHAGRRHR